MVWCQCRLIFFRGVGSGVGRDGGDEVGSDVGGVVVISDSVVVGLLVIMFMVKLKVMIFNYVNY